MNKDSDRSSVRPVFRRMPRWLLLCLFLLVGMPLHFANGVYRGLVEAYEAFKCEWQELRRIK